MQNRKRHHFKYSNSEPITKRIEKNEAISPEATEEQAPEARRDLKRVLWMIAGFVAAIVIVYFALRNQDLTRLLDKLKF